MTANTRSGVASYYRRPVPADPKDLPGWLSFELLNVQKAFQVPNCRTITASYTVTMDDDLILADATGGSITVTFPDPTRVTNKEFVIKRLSSGANTVTIAVTGGTTIDGGTSTLAAQWQTKRYRSNGTLWYCLSLL